MGLPGGWVTDVPISRNSQLKALGNGVVPQQAEAALRWLLGGQAVGGEDAGLLLPSPVASVSAVAPWKPDVEWWLQSRAARNLEAVVSGNTPLLLPTPAVNDMGAGKTPEAWDEWTAKMRAAHGNGNGHGNSLAVEAQRLLPTPSVSDGTGEHLTRSGDRADELLLPGVAKSLAGDQP